MIELRQRYEGVVQPEEIDELGHMNVRFYAQKARLATFSLAAELGLGAEACAEQGWMLSVTDAYTRHYREQLEGAQIAVRSGLLGIDAEGLRVYNELYNRESGELSATFVYRAQLLDLESRERRSLPEPLAGASLATIELPESGRPRSIDLSRPASAPSLEEVRRRGLGQRAARVVPPAYCDEAGFAMADALLDLVWGGDAVVEGDSAGDPLGQADSELDSSRMGMPATFGFATMESHLLAVRPPRAGARVQSFGAELEVGRKAALRRQWVFDLDRGDAVVVFSVVHLSFDMQARRAIEIPAPLRSMLERNYHPDLA